MTIWYYLYGEKVGNLSIYLRLEHQLLHKFKGLLMCLMAFRAEDGALERLEKKGGSEGNFWQRWLVNMPSRTEPYQVLIEATVDEPGLGDIAVDDIVFHENCKYYDGHFGTTTTPSGDHTTTSNQGDQTTTTNGDHVHTTTHGEQTTNNEHTTTVSDRPQTTTTTSQAAKPPNKVDKKVIITSVLVSILITAILAGIAYTVIKRRRLNK